MLSRILACKKCWTRNRTHRSVRKRIGERQSVIFEPPLGGHIFIIPSTWKPQIRRLNLIPYKNNQIFRGIFFDLWAILHLLRKPTELRLCCYRPKINVFSKLFVSRDQPTNLTRGAVLSNERWIANKIGKFRHQVKIAALGANYKNPSDFSKNEHTLRNSPNRIIP